MTEFIVSITSGHRKDEFEVHDNSHHDAAVGAAITGLDSFKRHGMTRFPYHDCDLQVTVRKVADEHE